MWECRTHEAQLLCVISTGDEGQVQRRLLQLDVSEKESGSQELASLGCKDLSPSKPQEEPPHQAEGLPPYSSELKPWRASRGSGKRKTLVKMCSHTL